MPRSDTRPTGFLQSRPRSVSVIPRVKLSGVWPSSQDAGRRLQDSAAPRGRPPLPAHPVPSAVPARLWRHLCLLCLALMTSVTYPWKMCPAGRLSPPVLLWPWTGPSPALHPAPHCSLLGGPVSPPRPSSAWQKAPALTAEGKPMSGSPVGSTLPPLEAVLGSPARLEWNPSRHAPSVLLPGTCQRHPPQGLCTCCARHQEAPPR